MPVEIKAVALAEKGTLRAMFSRYLLELTQNANIEIEYSFFESYLEDDQRYPYFILKNEIVVGFALVNTWSPSGKGTDRSVAEFYILPKHRRSGIGSVAFDKLLDSQPGIWELSVTNENYQSLHFWEKILSKLNNPQIERYEFEHAVVFRLASANDT